MSGALNKGVFSWPDAAVAVLRDLRQKGMSCTYIAKHLSSEFGHAISRNAVIGKCDRMGIAGPSRVALQAAAKIERARQSPPKIKTQKQRTGKDEIAERRAADLIKAAKVEAMVVPIRPVVDADLIAVEPKGIIALTHGCCRWPLNRTAEDGSTLFCCNAKDGDRPYCEGHAKRAYSRVITKDQRQAERLLLEQRREEARAAGRRENIFGFGLTKRFA